MPDEYMEYADRLIVGSDEELSEMLERDARRYNRAFPEEEEASLR